MNTPDHGTAWRHQSAGSFIAGTVKAARPERSQQALPLTLTSDIRHWPAGPKPRSPVQRSLQIFSRLAECGSTTGQRGQEPECPVWVAL